jgi:hypothetical protein
MPQGRFRPRTLMPLPPMSPADTLEAIMPDIIWLAVLGGLFLATLAYVRLCDNA